MLVTNDGTVKWNPKAHFVVWCPPENLGAWPSESHVCPLELTFRQDHIFMELEFNTNTSEIVIGVNGVRLVVQFIFLGKSKYHVGMENIGNSN